MSTPPIRRPYIVGCVKIPHADRDVAHAVLTPADDRGFYDVIGADDDPAVPLGANVTYRVELTDEEADRFRAASNCRYVELDGETRTCAGAVVTPAASSMRFMRADFPRADQFHGRDVLIAIMDAGTTTAVRNYLGVTMVARQVFSADQPGADEITAEHGCLVATCCLPRGGRFLDAITTNNDGTGSIAVSVAAAKWCADNGAKIINYSSGSPNVSTAWNDGMQYLLDRGVQFFSGAGNDGQNSLYYPGALSTTYPNVHCAIAFDETTGTRASFSNHAATASGCTPGANVLGFLPTARLVKWNGTSAAAPHMALLCAMGATGGRFTTAQVGAALKAHTRDTGQPAAEQGGGAYDLESALTALNAFSGLPVQSFRRNLSSNPSLETDTAGYALRSTRGGITAAIAGRSNTLAAPFGSFYLSISVTGNGSTSTTPDVEINLPTMPVTAGQTYTWSAHSHTAAIGATLQWAVQWQNDAGADLGTFIGANSPLFTSVWPRYYLTLTAPAGATRAVPWLRGFGFTETTLRSWRLDGLQYEQGGLGSYFDGATSGARWEGAANNSSSTVGIGGSGADYHPVAIIWPTSDRWPDDGELDFMENSRPGDDHAEEFSHYPHPSTVPVQQEHVTKAGVDLSQWHNFAIEKSPDGITGYLDGVQWFHHAGGAITGTRKNIQDMPSGHLTLQLDNFNGSSGNQPATMEVDWVRVYPLVPQGGGGTVGATLADRWRIGTADGLSKLNLGIDFLPNDGPSSSKGKHVDYPLNVLTQANLPAEFAGYCDLRADGAVRLTAYVGGATTPNSTHSRTETRQLARNGVDKAALSIRSGTCYAWARGAVIRAPQGDPRICLMQWHTATDDLCMIMWSGGNVISTFGNTGRPGTLATNVPLGSIHQYMIKIVGGSTARIEYYWDDMVTPKATQDTPGADNLYAKIGNYQQSDTGTDPVGEMAVVDLYDLEMWMTGMPEPAARH